MKTIKYQVNSIIKEELFQKYFLYYKAFIKNDKYIYDLCVFILCKNFRTVYMINLKYLETISNILGEIGM